MKNNYLAIGLSCILFAILTAAKQLGFHFFFEDMELAVTLTFFGFITLLTAFHKINRGTAFAATVIMLTGTILILTHYFEILDTADILFSSTLFVIGGGMLTLFFDNPKEYVFLLLAAALIALSLLTASAAKSCTLINYANQVTISVYNLWPVILIFVGIIYIIGKKK